MIGDAGLAFLSELADLETLRLDRTRVTHMGLVHLAVLTRLKQLYLNRTQAGDAGLEHLIRIVQEEQKLSATRTTGPRSSLAKTDRTGP